MLKSIKEQYADYISDAIASGVGIMTFAEWDHQRQQEFLSSHTVMLWSEKLQAYMTFSVREATSKTHAKELATKALRDFEHRHNVEVGPNGKVLTEEEMRQKMIDQAQRFLDAEQRKLEALRKKAMRLAHDLAK